MPGQTLIVENDQDYAAMQKMASGLRSLQWRTWLQVLLRPNGHGGIDALLALIFLILAALIIAGWLFMQY